MHVDLLRDKAKDFPSLQAPESITSLKVWHCSYQSMAPLAGLPSLRRLVIASYPEVAFEPIGRLQWLEELEVLHFPHVSSLQPLSRLQGLRTLSLASLPSWDASSKRLKVDSLAPLAQLPNLQAIHLLGVVTPTLSLAELEASKSLKEPRFHGYTRSEQHRFFTATGVVRASAA